jgi:hypothetical protein
MRRRDGGLVAGWALGIALAWWISGPLLVSARGWKALTDVSPRTACYVERATFYPFAPVAGLLCSALVTFLEVHGVIAPLRPRTLPLPRMPFDGKTTQLIIGEEHNQDGFLRADEAQVRPPMWGGPSRAERQSAGQAFPRL